MTSFRYADPVHVQSLDDCAFYHRIDLPGIGEVGTQWDLREVIDDYLGNYDFKGKRVLDVGTASGYLTFFMEQRGAEVVSFDMASGRQWDIVPFRDTWDRMDEILESAHQGHARLRNAYWYSHEKLKSRARVFYGDIYNLPEALGTFDVVVFGMILTHLRDPFRALYSAGRLSTGSIIVTNQTMKTDQPVATFVPSPENHEAQAWWALSDGCIEQMLRVLGFQPQHRATSQARCIVAGREGKELCTSIIAALPRPEAEIVLQAAYHEAAHVVATMAFGAYSEEFGVTLENVSDENIGVATALWMMSEADGGGTPPEDRRTFIENLIIISMAGSVAEQRFAPEHFDPVSSLDDDKFTDDMIGETLGSVDAGGANAVEKRGLLRQRTEQLIDERWNSISDLAAELAKQGSLQGDAVIAIVNGTGRQ